MSVSIFISFYYFVSFNFFSIFILLSVSLFLFFFRFFFFAIFITLPSTCVLIFLFALNMSFLPFSPSLSLYPATFTRLDLKVNFCVVLFSDCLRETNIAVRVYFFVCSNGMIAEESVPCLLGLHFSFFFFLLLSADKRKHAFHPR